MNILKTLSCALQNREFCHVNYISIKTQQAILENVPKFSQTAVRNIDIIGTTGKGSEGNKKHGFGTWKKGMLVLW